MKRSTLHYLYDPLCGWCYAAAPLVAIARDLPDIELQLHGGGLMAGANRQAVSAELRGYVMQHDQRIAALSGQPFGAAYFDGLLRDSGAIFDSEPPTAAILAADAIAGRGAELLARLQQAHYVEGRRIADASVLQELAADIDLDPGRFAAAFAAHAGEPTRRHIADSRRRLAAAGGRGFPTFIVERDGHSRVLDASACLGQPERWQAELLRP
ncbi:MAG: DsbA family protein [Solimonas sp.]